MGKRIKKLKKVRLHREGTNTLLYSGIAIAVIAALLWYLFDTKIPFWIFIVLFGIVYCTVVNFYRCPIRYYGGDTENIVVAPADGRIAEIERVVRIEGDL